jgi:4-carboxymuconolactone decarboxylase
MSDDDLFAKGLQVRREVLGSEYVDQSLAGADEFTRTMAEWSTAYCWGALWTRPGMDRKTRSIVNLAMISALNRPCMGTSMSRFEFSGSVPPGLLGGTTVTR